MFDALQTMPDYIANIPYLVAGVIVIIWLTRKA